MKTATLAVSVVTLSMLVLLGTVRPAMAQDAAGKVVFAQGQPVALDSAGTERTLSRGSEVFSGDTLVTGAGRLQLSMVDGAFISVQPGSEYALENYSYSGSPDGTENASYRLVKGGVRAVTGLIGRQNPEAYKVNTAVATIGIRGTGHNTRICQGDCASREDGLYHSTWEGITFVVNDVDVADVPAGTGVFVRDIDTDIEILDQPPAVLAIDTTREREEEEQEETEEQTQVVASGEQRDETGDQTIVVVARDEVLPPTAEPEPEPVPEPEPPVTPAVTSTVISNIGLLGVAPDAQSTDSVNIIDFEFGTSLFRRDTDNKVVAVLGDEFDDFDETTRLTFATIDLDAALGGDNATDVATVQSLLDAANAADPTLVSLFEANPATAAEFFQDTDIGYGRWADGRILVLGDDGDHEVVELVNNQSVHFLFGIQPPPLPLSGTASYVFIDGTQSTSASGDTIGDGVTNGVLSVAFGDTFAYLQMDITHDSLDYLVSGPLSLDTTDGSLFDNNNVLATGGVCDPDCLTFIDGGFAGPGDGIPKHVGFEYDIQAQDVIMGVALFGHIELVPTTVLSNSVFVAAAPDEFATEQFELLTGFQGALFADGSDVLGALFTEDDGVTRSFGTVDLNSVLAGNDTAAVTEVENLLQAADQTIVESFTAADKAVVMDSFQHPTDGVGWGRWTSGAILTLDNTGSTGSDVETFTGHQSVHFIYGQDPGTLPTSGTANYNFLAGGTPSTSASGATIGDGVTSGAIAVDFGTTSASINMEVSHAGAVYSVIGPLGVDAVNNGIFDEGGVSASTTAVGSACNSMCGTWIEGGFAGPSDLGTPRYIGIGYGIQESDPITGVAGFGNGLQF